MTTCDELPRLKAKDLQGTWVDGENGDLDWKPADKRAAPVEVELVLWSRNVPSLLKTVEKFSRIAERHGQVVRAEPAGTVEVSHPLWGDERPITKFRYIVTIPPMVGEKGRILGHFERAEDGESLYIHVFDEPSRTLVEGYLPRAGECDHCGVKRERNLSYVCETSDGPKIVGSTCLKDFLGIDPAWAIGAWEFTSRLDPKGDRDEDESWGGGGVKFVGTEEVAREAYRVGRKHGGYASDEEGKAQLYRELRVLLFGANDKFEHAIRDSYKDFQPEFDVQALADYVQHATGDFGSNLRTALSQDRVSVDRLRIVLAGVCLFVGRALKRADEVKQHATLPPAKHLQGAVGERIEVVGQVIRTYVRAGDFGETCIISIRTADGGAAVNFHTGQDRPEAGKVYAIRGTIKRQGNQKNRETGAYDGPAETTLTRVAYKELPEQGLLFDV